MTDHTTSTDSLMHRVKNTDFNKLSLKKGIFNSMILAIFIQIFINLGFSHENQIDMLCVMKNASPIIEIAQEANTTDKQKHCFVSCALTLKCEAGEVLLMGISKEIWDLITPGNADMEDIWADIKGIEFAERGVARNQGQCFNFCSQYYP